MLPYRSTLPLGGANLFSFYIDLKQNNSRRSIPRENRRGDKRLAPRAKPGALGFLLQWVRNQQQGVGLQLQLQLHPQPLLQPQLQPQLQSQQQLPPLQPLLPQQHQMMISRMMIQQQLPPPKPLLHIRGTSYELLAG